MLKGFLVFLFFLLCSQLFSDAGYLRSVTSGPSPVLIDNDSIEIQMSYEEVFISIYEDSGIIKAQVNSVFVFDNFGDESEVLMYFPLEVRTPFYPVGLSNYWADSLKIEVLVDGKICPVDIFYYDVWDSSMMRDMSWEEFSACYEVLNINEPQEGEPLFYKIDEKSRDFAYEAKALLAFWKVKFDEKSTKFIEFSQEYLLTSDYENKMFRLSYPLFTGSSWANNIRKGRISVLFEDEEVKRALKFFIGSLMPLPEVYLDGYTASDPLKEISERYKSDNLSKFYNRSYAGAIIWNFSDLEPLPANFRHHAFYPDIPDVGTEIMMEYMNFMEGSITEFKNPWCISFVYIILGDYHPNSYYVRTVQGVDFYENRELMGLPVFYAHYLSSLKLIEIGDSSSKFEVRDYFSGNFDQIKKGWTNFYYIDENNLLVPKIFPVLESYYDDFDNEG